MLVNVLNENSVKEKILSYFHFFLRVVVSFQNYIEEAEAEVVDDFGTQQEVVEQEAEEEDKGAVFWQEGTCQETTEMSRSVTKN